MTWVIERGVYENHPITRTPHEVSRVWRFHPPPWKLVFSTSDHEFAEEVVKAHNEDVTAAGETPQLGLLPRRTIVQALERFIGLHAEQFNAMETHWIENHIKWLKDPDRPVPTIDDDNPPDERVPYSGYDCAAILFHGPGHQSRTPCRIRGSHPIDGDHEVIYGEDQRYAHWRGPKATTGVFDEPPREEA
jgi:hypothetical protein